MIKHTVRAGESLSLIAKAYLGDPMRYTELARANGIANPNAIHVGQVIVIPEADDLTEIYATGKRLPDGGVLEWEEGDAPIPVASLAEISVTGKRDPTLLILAGIIAALALTDKGKRLF